VDTGAAAFWKQRPDALGGSVQGVPGCALPWLQDPCAQASLVQGFPSLQLVQALPFIPQAFEVLPPTQPAVEQQSGPLQQVPSQHVPGTMPSQIVPFGSGSFTHPNWKSQ